MLKAGATGVLAALAGCVNPDNDTTNTIDDNRTNDSTNNTTNPQDDGSMEATADATITLNNQGASAWVVTSVDGTTQEGIQTGEPNTSIQLFEDKRYKFVNNGGRLHPLAFRDSNGATLLSGSGSGDLEDDPNVNWVERDGEVEFTVTSELADRLNEYYCTIHASMSGSVGVGTPVP